MTSKHPVEEWLSLCESKWTYSQIAARYNVTRNVVAGAKRRAVKPDETWAGHAAWRARVNREKSAAAWRAELERRKLQYGHLLERVTPGTRGWIILSSFLEGKTLREIGSAAGIASRGAYDWLSHRGIRGAPKLRAYTRPSLEVDTEE
jgi:hypothetical protein